MTDLRFRNFDKLHFHCKGLWKVYTALSAWRHVLSIMASLRNLGSPILVQYYGYPVRYLGELGNPKDSKFPRADFLENESI